MKWNGPPQHEIKTEEIMICSFGPEKQATYGHKGVFLTVLDKSFFSEMILAPFCRLHKSINTKQSHVSTEFSPTSTYCWKESEFCIFISHNRSRRQNDKIKEQINGKKKKIFKLTWYYKYIKICKSTWINTKISLSSSGEQIKAYWSVKNQN